MHYVIQAGASLRLLVVLLVSMALYGCGGGGSGDATPPPGSAPNAAPVIAPVRANTPQGAALTIDVGAAATDQEGDLDPASVQVVAPPTSGSVVINADGTVVYTPNQGFVRTDAFSVSIGDNAGARSQPQRVQVDVLPRTVAMMVTPLGGQNVVSADGNLTLTVPAGAVTSDTEITVTQLTASELPNELIGQDVIAGYELTPDGATFANALQVEMLLQEGWEDGVQRGPLVLLARDAQGIQLLETPVSEVQNDGTLATGGLGHFSQLFVIRLSSIFARPIDAPVTAEVGETFRASYLAQTINVADGTRVFTGRFSPYAAAPLVEIPVFQVRRQFIAGFAPVSSASYLTDIEFTTPAATSGIGEIFGTCVLPGSTDIELEIYSQDPPAAVPTLFGRAFAFPIVNVTSLPELVVRLSIPVNCVAVQGVAGDPPATAPDTATTNVNTSTTIAVLDNDVDPDGDLAPATLRVASQPANGAANVLAGGLIEYSPTLGFTGTDVFTYLVSDLGGNSAAPTTVTVEVGVVQATPPVANNDSATTSRGTSVTIRVLDNDQDAEGDIDPSTLRLRDGANNGQSVVNATGTVSYTPDPGFAGDDSFTYLVSDATGLSSNEATVIVRVSTPNNAAPVASPDSATTSQNQSVDIDVLLNDADPEGDPLINLRISRAPSAGTALALSRSVRYIPDAGASGMDSFEYTVDDDQGNTSTPGLVEVTVGVVSGGNSPPQVMDDAATTTVNVPVTLNVIANDTDPDGSIAVGSVQISAAPRQGAAVANANGSVTFTPTDVVSVETFRYTVADNDGARSAEATVTITVQGAGVGPTAFDDVADTFVDTPVNIAVSLNDSGNGMLLTVDDIVIETPADNGTTLPINGGVRYTPDPGFNGVDTFRYSISNATLQRDSATVTVTVNVPINLAPVANDDSASIPPNQLALIAVLDNDTDPDGRIDPATVVVSSQPANGIANVGNDGLISYQPNAAFIGMDTLSYQVQDNGGSTSNEATVTINVGDFLGVDMPPTDNVSAAELQFLVRFGGRFAARGIGVFVGFNYADDMTVANGLQVGDYSVLYANVDSERAPLEPYRFETDFQTGTTMFVDGLNQYRIAGFDALPIFNGIGGQLTVSSDADPSLSFSILAPDAPVLDGDAQPLIVRSYDGLKTVVQYPDDAFTHMFVRFVTRQPDGSDRRIFLARFPREAMALDAATNMRFRAITDAQVRARLDVLRAIPQGDIAIVFYNQEDNTTFFPGITRRPVPLAAGRGISLPADQLVERKPLNCSTRPVGVRCQGGPNRRLLAANRNGDVTIHDPVDGSFIGRLIGETVPNFLVGQGRHVVQDPGTNCLLFSDTQATLSSGARGGAIHLYDTDGTALDANFIEQADGGTLGLARPRGMAVFEGELLVATENDGRVLRFNPATGAFIGERVNDPAIGPRDIEVLASGEILVTDASSTGSTDRVWLYATDPGEAPTLIAGDLSNPSQISTSLDLNFNVADFSVGQVRTLNQGAPNLFAVNLGVDANGDIQRPVGVFGLDNGNLLVTGDRGVGVSVLDPSDPANGLPNAPLVNGSSFEFISEVCLDR